MGYLTKIALTIICNLVFSGFSRFQGNSQFTENKNCRKMSAMSKPPKEFIGYFVSRIAICDEIEKVLDTHRASS